MLLWTCPSCGKQLQSKAELAGQQVVCPSCKTRVQLLNVAQAELTPAPQLPPSNPANAFPKFDPTPTPAPPPTKQTASVLPASAPKSVIRYRETPEFGFWILAVGGLLTLMFIGWVNAEHENKTSRADAALNAVMGRSGTTHEIIEILKDFDQGSTLMRWCYLALLWLIFVSLCRINRMIKTQTTRLLAAANSQRPKHE